MLLAHASSADASSADSGPVLQPAPTRVAVPVSDVNTRAHIPAAGRHPGSAAHGHSGAHRNASAYVNAEAHRDAQTDKFAQTDEHTHHQTNEHAHARPTPGAHADALAAHSVRRR